MGAWGVCVGGGGGGGGGMVGSCVHFFFLSFFAKAKAAERDVFG